MAAGQEDIVARYNDKCKEHVLLEKFILHYDTHRQEDTDSNKDRATTTQNQCSYG